MSNPGTEQNANLVEAWFEHWKTKRSDLQWAWDEVTDKMLANSPDAWPLLLELIEAAPGDDALSYVAAGPLENFLCEHGPAFLGALSSAADGSLRVRQALRGVWGKNRMDAEVWSEVQRLARG